MTDCHILHDFARKIVPVYIGLLSATSTSNNAKTIPYYGVVFQDMDYYYVTDDLFNKEDGIDYACDFDYQQPCVVASLAQPDELYRIPKISAFQIKEGRFRDLTP